MPPKRRGGAGGDDGEVENTRIAIVDNEKCKPKKCRQECKRSCPVVRLGKICIEVTPSSKVAWISEELCIGCGICVKKCPFEAINIINLPKALASETAHRYGPNSFKLHRLPLPRANEVLGLVGTNGIGKSTALKILAGKLKPNLGHFDAPPDWEDILKHWRGSELQNYFTKVLEDNLRAVIKPQYVDHIPRAVSGTVGKIIGAKDQREVADTLLPELDLDHLLDREVDKLSGGELQRFAIAVVAVQIADVYMFDEPSSYLDVRQRLKAAQVIRSLLDAKASGVYVICVEHDLSVLDYLSDFICCLYGRPGAYGVVTMPFSVREGINVFLAGFIPTENMRFRDEELTFKVASSVEEEKVGEGGKGTRSAFEYPTIHKILKSPKHGTQFKLTVEAGHFSNSQILVMLGENGTGKTTFIRMLAGLLKPDPEEEGEEPPELEGFAVSYKPQKIAPKFDGSVRQLLTRKIRDAYAHPQFNTDVMRPLNMENIIDQDVKHLSGGELQRVALCLCLGKPAAQLFLIDEPSAFLDVEQRLAAVKSIEAWVAHSGAACVLVEHDFLMATALADAVVVFSGTPGVDCTAAAPCEMVAGVNEFLRIVGVTFRRDRKTGRPRMNEPGCRRDKEQKKAGRFFFVDA